MAYKPAFNQLVEHIEENMEEGQYPCLINPFLELDIEEKDGDEFDGSGSVRFS